MQFIALNFNLDDAKVLYEDELKILKNSKHIFLKPIKLKHFKIYLVYFILICLGFYFYENQTIDNSSYKLFKEKFLAVKNEKNFKYVSAYIKKIYENAQIHNININNVEYKYSEFNLNIQTTKKSNINSFLKEFKNAEVSNITFDKETKKQVLNVYLRFY